MAGGEKKQAEKLPLTTSSIVTESKGTFMGLDGMGFFVVILSFVVTLMVVNMFSENMGFPVGVVAAVLSFVVMRFWMRGKPDKFLLDTIIFPMRPKLFEHRPRSKRQIFKDDDNFQARI